MLVSIITILDLSVKITNVYYKKVFFVDLGISTCQIVLFMLFDQTQTIQLTIQFTFC